MWAYYLFMALLVVTLVLWAIIALRDDGYENGEPARPEKRNAPSPSKAGDERPR